MEPWSSRPEGPRSQSPQRLGHQSPNQKDARHRTQASAGLWMQATVEVKARTLLAVVAGRGVHP